MKTDNFHDQRQSLGAMVDIIVRLLQYNWIPIIGLASTHDRGMAYAERVHVLLLYKYLPLPFLV